MVFQSGRSIYYADAPKDVYRRHANCKCIVLCRTEKGTYQDVWSKKEYKTQREARIAKEQELVEDSITRDQRINIVTAKQAGGDAKIPESLKGNFDDCLPLQLDDFEKNTLQELNEMSAKDGFEHGFIITKKQW